MGSFHLRKIDSGRSGVRPCRRTDTIIVLKACGQSISFNLIGSAQRTKPELLGAGFRRDGELRFRGCGMLILGTPDGKAGARGVDDCIDDTLVSREWASIGSL